MGAPCIILKAGRSDTQSRLLAFGFDEQTCLSRADFCPDPTIFKRMSDEHDPDTETPVVKVLTPAARRALAEAAERRAAAEHRSAQRDDADSQPNEEGGPSGPEPTRFGDWERNGLTRDF